MYQHHIIHPKFLFIRYQILLNHLQNVSGKECQLTQQQNMTLTT